MNTAVTMQLCQKKSVNLKKKKENYTIQGGWLNYEYKLQ